jgi:hypothetical protein
MMMVLGQAPTRVDALDDARERDAFDALEVFEMVRHLNDPEHPLTLEQLSVTKVWGHTAVPVVCVCVCVCAVCVCVKVCVAPACACACMPRQFLRGQDTTCIRARARRAARPRVCGRRQVHGHGALHAHDPALQHGYHDRPLHPDQAHALAAAAVQGVRGAAHRAAQA